MSEEIISQENTEETPINDNVESKSSVSTKKPDPIEYKKFDSPETETGEEPKDKKKTMDFGAKVLDGYTGSALKNVFGVKEATLYGKDYYWKEGGLEKILTKKYGDKAAEEYDKLYANMQGEYARFLQDEHQIDYLINDAPTIGMLGEFNPFRSMFNKPIYEETKATVTNSSQFGDFYYSPKNSAEEAYSKIVRIPIGRDSKNIMQFKFEELTSELKEALLASEGIDGLAYNRLQLAQGPNARIDPFVDVIKNNKVWDDVSNSFKDLRGDQLVSRWNLANQSLFGKLMRNDGLDIDGISGYAMLVPKSIINTGFNIADIIPQYTRAGLGLFGESGVDTDLYRYMTKAGVYLQGNRTTLSSTARREGFLGGNMESIISTTGDVFAQLMAAGYLGKATGGAVSRLVGRSEQAIANSSAYWSRLGLTMMASKDFYQGSLDVGFSSQASAVSLGIATAFMWQANKLSNNIFGGETAASRFYGKKVIMGFFERRKGAIAKGLIDDTRGGLTRGIKNTIGTSMNWTLKKYADVSQHKIIGAAITEGMEEIFEEISSEATRQLMNSYLAIRGFDLKNLKAGEERYSSYWDKDYWKHFREMIATAGIAGAMGGPMGKMIHGHTNMPVITDESTITDFVMSGHSELLMRMTDKLAKKYKFAPQGLSTEIDDKTGAFVLGGSDINSINTAVRDLIKVSIETVNSSIKSFGIDRAVEILKKDKDLKANMDNSNVLEDLKTIAIELRALVEKTGITAEMLTSLQDPKMDEILRGLKEGNAVYRDDLETKRTEEKEKAKEVSDEHKEEGEVKKEKEEEVAKEEAKKEQENKEKSEESTEDTSKSVEEFASKHGDDFTKMVELVRRVRGVKNGAAAGDYFSQYANHSHSVFGSMQNRADRFKKYGENLFKNLLMSSRESAREANMDTIHKVKIMEELSKKALAVNESNVFEFLTELTKESALTTEAVKHLEEIVTNLAVNEGDVISKESAAFLSSDEVIDVQYKALVDKVRNDDYTVPKEGGIALNKDKVGIDVIELIMSPEFQAIFKVLALENADIGQFTTVEFDEGSYLDLIQFKDNLSTAFEAAVRNSGIVQGTEGIDVIKYYPDSAELIKMTEEFAEIRKPFKDPLKDPRKIRSMIALIDSKGNIDVKMPKSYDPMNASWIDADLDLDTMKTIPGSITEKVAKLTGEGFLEIYDNGEKFAMDPAHVKELARLREVIEIRQAQRDILAGMVIIKSENGSSFNHTIINKLATFNKDISKLIGDEMYPLSPKHSEDRGHLYKDSTVLADFMNDFFYDPVHISSILSKVKQTSKGDEDYSDLAPSELELINNLKDFLSKNLASRDAIGIIQKNEETGKNETVFMGIVKQINNLDSLALGASWTHQGMPNVETDYSLEQAIEVIDGISYLLENNPAGNAEDIKSSNMLENRQYRMEQIALSIFRERNNILQTINDLYEDEGKEVPTSVSDLLAIRDNNYDPDHSYLDGLVTKYGKMVDMNTREDKIKLEVLVTNFLIDLNNINKELGDKLHDSEFIADKTSPNKEELFLQSLFNTDVKEWITGFKEFVDNINDDENGKYPIIDQELNMLFINSFIQSDNDPSVVLLFLQGNGGTGKTDIVASYSMYLAQQMLKAQGKTATDVLFASEHTLQRDLLGKSLTDRNIETIDDGIDYDFKAILGMLKSYNSLDDSERPGHVVETLMTIMFDEATNINSRLPIDSKKEEATLDSLRKELIIANINRSVRGLSPLKMILTGDNNQLGYKDSNGATDIRSYMRASGQLEVFIMSESMRVSNPYVQKLGDIRHANNKNKQFKWGLQKKYGNKLMGADIRHQVPIDDILNDDVIYNNILEQLKDPNFSVGVVVDDPELLKKDSKIMKLMADEDLNKQLPNKPTRQISLVSTSEVQGLEYNYVLTEFTTKFVGDPLSDDAELASMSDKAIHTLFTRVKDFIAVANGSRYNGESTQDDDHLLLPNADDMLKNKKILYNYYSEVHSKLAFNDNVEESNDSKKKEEEKEVKKEEEEEEPQLTKEEKDEIARKKAKVEDDRKKEEEKENNKKSKEEKKKKAEEAKKKIDDKKAEDKRKKDASDAEKVRLSIITEVEALTMSVAIDDSSESRMTTLFTDFYNKFTDLTLEDVGRIEVIISNSIAEIVDAYFSPFVVKKTEEFNEKYSDEFTTLHGSIEDSYISSIKKFKGYSRSVALLALSPDAPVQDITKFVEAQWAKIVAEEDYKYGIVDGVNSLETIAKKEIKKAALEHNEYLKERIKKGKEKKTPEEIPYGEKGGKHDVEHSMFNLKQVKEEAADLIKLLKTLDLEPTFDGYLAYRRKLLKEDSSAANKKLTRLDAVMHLILNEEAKLKRFLIPRVSRSTLKFSENKNRRKAVFDTYSYDEFNIPARELYNINQNQNKNGDGIMQVYPVLDDQRDIAKKVIDMDNLSFEESDIRSVLSGEIGANITFTIKGSNTIKSDSYHDSYSDNLYVVASGGNLKFPVVVGKFFLGINKRTDIARIKGNIEAYNSKVEWADTTKKLHEDDTDEDVVNKLFPNTKWVRDVVSANTDITIELSRDEFIDTFGLEAGKLVRDHKASYEELKISAEANGASISDIYVNTSKGQEFKSVYSSNPFVLYTFNKSIDLTNPAVVEKFLEFLLTTDAIDSQQIGTNTMYTDIGIIPMTTKKVTFDEVFSKYSSEFKNMVQGNTSQDEILIPGDEALAFRKKGEDLRIMQTLLGITKFYAEKGGLDEVGPFMNDPNHPLSNPLIPQGKISMVYSETELLAITEEIDEYSSDISTPYHIETDEESGKSKKIDDNVNITQTIFDDFISKLQLNSEGLAHELLSPHDLISSVFMPILRNVSPIAFKKFTGRKYLANHYAMFSRNEYKGKDVLIFSPTTMMGAIAKELYTRMMQKVDLDESKKDEVWEYTKELMEETILPVISELIANSGVNANFAEISSDNNILTAPDKTITKQAEFTMNVSLEFEDFVEFTQFTKAKISKSNYSNVTSNVSGLQFPNMNVGIESLRGILENVAPDETADDIIIREEGETLAKLVIKYNTDSKYNSEAMAKDHIDVTKLTRTDKTIRTNLLATITEKIQELFKTFDDRFIEMNSDIKKLKVSKENVTEVKTKLDKIKTERKKTLDDNTLYQDKVEVEYNQLVSALDASIASVDVGVNTDAYNGLVQILDDFKVKEPTNQSIVDSIFEAISSEDSLPDTEKVDLIKKFTEMYESYGWKLPAGVSVKNESKVDVSSVENLLGAIFADNIPKEVLAAKNKELRALEDISKSTLKRGAKDLYDINATADRKLFSQFLLKGLDPDVSKKMQANIVDIISNKDKNKFCE